MTAYDTAILADGPQSYWALAESSGTAAADTAGSNPLTYTGGFTLNAVGIGDGAGSVTLNGTTGYVRAASTSSPAITSADGPVTCEAWIYPSSIAGPAGIFAHGLSGWYLRVYQSKLDLLSANNADIGSSTTNLVTSAWNYVAFTKSGAAIHLYLNGVDVTGTMTNTTCTGDSSITLGANYVPNGEYLPAQLAKAAVYNKVLTPAQILAHYNARTGGSVATIADTRHIRTRAGGKGQ